MTFAGILLASYPFVGSLNPTDSALDNSKTRINLAEVEVGQLREFKDALGRPIWIYHRTDEQVEWINSYQPVNTIEYGSEYIDSEEFGGKYRSLDPRYFVFTARQIRGLTYLQQERYWTSCGTIKYHSGDIEVNDGHRFKGVLACLKDHDVEDYKYLAHVYDVAGVASSEYTAPLPVPFYELKGDGYIVVGPKP